ncbi:MAG: hypothetical protein CVV13_05235 [Gammaproteobacteria bacterium HGW-Gammaproteobacteria-3]|nr:MAG: hypothetical protein CVV13_05235 [Gammaproteobacteria bacterium HGW-Gammaproteobacteria-3]
MQYRRHYTEGGSYFFTVNLAGGSAGFGSIPSKMKTISAITSIDTLKYANKLKAAGAESRIAETEAEALAEVFELNLKEVATREDLKQMEERLNERQAAL